MKAFEDEGMSVPLVTAPGDFTDPADARAAPLFAACGEAGVGLIKLGYWPFRRGDDYWELGKACRGRLEGFAELAREHGVKVVVHTHSGAYMGLNASAALHLVDGFDPEEVGVFLDAGHLAMCGEPMPMALGIAGKYVSCLAFKDLVRLPERLPGQNEGREVYRIRPRKLGWGVVDWHEVVQGVLDNLDEAKLRGLPISLHSEYGGIPADSVVDIARADRRFIKGLFSELGGK